MTITDTNLMWLINAGGVPIKMITCKELQTYVLSFPIATGITIGRLTATSTDTPLALRLTDQGGNGVMDFVTDGGGGFDIECNGFQIYGVGNGPNFLFHVDPTWPGNVNGFTGDKVVGGQTWHFNNGILMSIT